MSTIVIYRVNPHGPGSGSVFIYPSKNEAINDIVKLMCHNKKFKYSWGTKAEEKIRNQLEKRNYLDACEVAFELFETSMVPNEYICIEN